MAPQSPIPKKNFLSTTNNENIKPAEKSATFFKLQKVPLDDLDDHSVNIRTSFDVMGSDDKEKTKEFDARPYQETRPVFSSCNNFSIHDCKTNDENNPQKVGQQKFKSFMSEFAQKLNLRKSKDFQKSVAFIPSTAPTTNTAASAKKEPLKEINFNIYANMANINTPNKNSYPIA